MIVVADNGLTLEGNDFKMGEVEYEMVEPKEAQYKQACRPDPCMSLKREEISSVYRNGIRSKAT